MQSAAFIDKDLCPSPFPGGEFCTVVKQITFVKFRLWEAAWNSAAKAAELIWDMAAGNLDKNHEGIEVVKSF